jgi:hypothetical protein
MVELTGRGGLGEMDLYCTVTGTCKLAFGIQLEMLPSSAPLCTLLLGFSGEQPALAEKPLEHDVESVRDGGPLRA